MGKEKRSSLRFRNGMADLDRKNVGGEQFVNAPTKCIAKSVGLVQIDLGENPFYSP